MAARAVMGVIWSILSGQLCILIGFVGSVVLARLLAPSDFGTFGLAFAIVELSAIVCLNFPQALIQSSNYSQELADSAWWLSASQGVLIAAVGTGAAAFCWVSMGAELGRLTLVLALARVPSVLSGIYQANFERRLAYGALAWRRILVEFLPIAGTIGAAIAGFGIWSLALRTVLSALVGLAVHMWRCPWSFRGNFDRAAAMALTSYSARLFFVGAIERFFWRVDSLLVGLFLGEETLGYYNQSRSVTELSNKIMSPVSLYVSFSALSRLQGDPRRFEIAYGKVIFFLSRVCTLFAAVAFAAPEEILVFLFGKQWAPAAPIFRALSLLMLFHPLFEAAKTRHLAVGAIGKLVIRYAAIAVGLPCALIVILKAGLGAVGASVCLVGMVAAGYVMFSDVSLGKAWLSNVKGFIVLTLAGVLAAAAGSWARGIAATPLWALVLVAFVAFGVYFAVLGILEGRRLLAEIRDVLVRLRESQNG